MKFIVSIICLLATQAFAFPHLDLEMTSQEYRALYHSMPISREVKDAEDVELEQYVHYGELNLQWLELINSNRPADNKISLTSEAVSHGFPINSPRRLNFKGIQEEWAVLKALMPASLKAVIFDGGAMTAQIPVSERAFIEWMRQVDDAYQLSTRYRMMKPWKQDMAAVAAQDVRGYLLMKDDAQYDQKLTNWSQNSIPAQNLMIESLVQICRNSNVKEADCRAEVAAGVVAGKLVDIKNKYFAAAETNYNSFFMIPIARKDLTWTADSNGSLLTAPFANPHNERVVEYLRSNIEDEWKWNDWKLQLNFVETDSADTTHVVFEAGTTPHVNDLAGSEISMDANAPLSEYDVQWTIRHEYGHVLGFPDCYIEFYEESTDTIMSYQLDITNLMCSRRGHIQQRHFDELKRVYGKM